MWSFFAFVLLRAARNALTAHTKTDCTYVDDGEIGAGAGGYVMGLMHDHDNDVK
jgi:hypothetical protein